MSYEVEVSDEFKDWYEPLSLEEQLSVRQSVTMLADAGPALSFPYSSGIEGSKYGHMRELRVQHQGRPYRILYAFDPRRAAFLLIGGDKTGDDRWYERMIPKADSIYERHLQALEREHRVEDKRKHSR